MFTGPYRTSFVNSDALIGWWKLNDAQGTDSSPSGNNGVIHGAPFPANGVAGFNALQFNGSTDYIEMPTAVISSGDATFAAWVSKQHTVSGNNTVIGVFGTNGGARNSFYVSAGATNQIGFVQFQAGSFFTTSTTATAFPDNTWAHFAGTFVSSSGACQLYINGVSVAFTGTLNPGWGTGLVLTDIGVQYQNATNTYVEFWPGLLDDIRIYNRVLSADEILQLYAEPFEPPIDLESVPFLPTPLTLMGQIWLA
jgi:hypothetical protein